MQFGKEGLQPKYAAKLIPKPEPSAAKETEQGEGEAKTEQGEGEAKTEQGEGEAKTEQGEGEAKTEQGEGEAKIEQGEGGVAVADLSPKQTGMRRLAFLIKITFILVLKKNKNRIYRKGRAS